jgi:cold shock CspA family protein
MFWGQVHDVQRGRVKRFFSDKSRPHGFGFLEPIDADGQRILRQPDVFFHITKGCHIRPSHVPGEVQWVRQYMSEYGEMLEPNQGDILIFHERKGVNGKPEAVPWAHESDYEKAKVGSSLMRYRLVDTSPLWGGIIWEGLYSPEHHAAMTKSGELPPDLTDAMVFYTDRRTDPTLYFTAEYTSNPWEEVCGGEGVLRSIRASLTH